MNFLNHGGWEMYQMRARQRYIHNTGKWSNHEVTMHSKVTIVVCKLEITSSFSLLKNLGIQFHWFHIHKLCRQAHEISSFTHELLYYTITLLLPTFPLGPSLQLYLFEFFLSLYFVGCNSTTWKKVYHIFTTSLRRVMIVRFYEELGSRVYTWFIEEHRTLGAFII